MLYNEVLDPNMESLHYMQVLILQKEYQKGPLIDWDKVRIGTSCISSHLIPLTCNC